MKRFMIWLSDEKDGFENSRVEKVLSRVMLVAVCTTLLVALGAVPVVWLIDHTPIEWIVGAALVPAAWRWVRWTLR